MIGAGLLCLNLLSAGLLGHAADQPAIPRPNVDIDAVRSGYYQGLDKARAAALDRLAAEGQMLRHDADGNVIQDAAYDRAVEHYRAEKERLAAEVRRDPRRDAELDALREHAKLGPHDMIDSGTPPGHPAYGGGFSDRDVILGSTKQVNTLADSARQRGYTVEYGQGYVKIKELDVVVWDPDRITIRKTGDGEPIVQPKKRSATEQVDRLHDKEVVLGHEKPGVAQQVKVERRQRADEVRALTLERQDLHQQLRATADGGEAARLQGEIDARNRQLRQLQQQQLGDDLTLKVVAKKNTQLQDQVIRPKQPTAEIDVPHTPSKGAEWAGKGVSLVGQAMDLYDAYSQEAAAAAREKRNFSQAKMAVNLFANATGITQVVSSVEGFAYETGAGMKEYAQREAERLEREGYDVAVAGGADPGAGRASGKTRRRRHSRESAGAGVATGRNAASAGPRHRRGNQAGAGLHP